MILIIELALVGTVRLPGWRAEINTIPYRFWRYLDEWVLRDSPHRRGIFPWEPQQEPLTQKFYLQGNGVIAKFGHIPIALRPSRSNG